MLEHCRRPASTMQYHKPGDPIDTCTKRTKQYALCREERKAQDYPQSLAVKTLDMKEIDLAK